jgi:hypothetical protein
MMKERATIIRFLAVQFVRTAGAFAQQADLGDQLESMLRADGIPEEYFKPPPEVGTSENARKANFAGHICGANKDLGPALCSKEWILFQTDLQQPFLLGDHPVVLDNLYGGKLGLGVPGVVIYFPLSPEYALGLHCLSIAEEFRQEHERLAGRSDEELVRNPSLYACFEQTVCILEGFQKGLPVQLQPENVENFNSLQVINAERLVFSSDGNFNLVEDMMRTNPELRKGPRIAVKRGL